MFQFGDINKKFDDEITKSLDRLRQVIPSMGSKDQDGSDQVRVEHTDHRVIQEDGQEINNVDEVFKSMDTVEIDRLGKLLELKKAYNADRQETIQTLIKAGMTLSGILMLLTFERENVITSKALSFIPKAKI